MLPPGVQHRLVEPVLNPVPLKPYCKVATAQAVARIDDDLRRVSSMASSGPTYPLFGMPSTDLRHAMEIIAAPPQLQTVVAVPAAVPTAVAPALTIADLLPTQTITARDCDLHCGMCQTNVEVDQVVQTLPCFHRFHAVCLAPWLELYDYCPQCRTLISPTASVAEV